MINEQLNGNTNSSDFATYHNIFKSQTFIKNKDEISEHNLKDLLVKYNLVKKSSLQFQPTFHKLPKESLITFLEVLFKIKQNKNINYLMNHNGFKRCFKKMSIQYDYDAWECDVKMAISFVRSFSNTIIFMKFLLKFNPKNFYMNFEFQNINSGRTAGI